MRQVVLDTETTGLEVDEGHRILEIGCVEVIDRRRSGRTLQHYVNPQREVEAGALRVHGISNEVLAGKPLFADVVDEMFDFIGEAEVIIHNAAFDVGFINHELRLIDSGASPFDQQVPVVDSLAIARRMHPGTRISLDALCKRYGIDTSRRELHGALLDAEILADVYLLLTGGQTAMSLRMDQPTRAEGENLPPLPDVRVIPASGAEQAAHEQRLDALEADGGCLWRELELT